MEKKLNAWVAVFAAFFLAVWTFGLVAVMRQGSPVVEAALSPRGLSAGSAAAVTVTSGDCTPTAAYCTIAAAGDLSRLWAGSGYAQTGDILVLATSVDANDVTVWDGVASGGAADDMYILQLGAASRALDNSLDRLVLMFNGTAWCEIAFSSNGS